MLDEMKREYCTSNRGNMWWFFVTIIISHSLFFNVSGQCTSQTPPCRLSCHCSDQSRCPDVTTRMCGSGGCASGWSGPTCQRNNVAMNDQDTLKASSVFGDSPSYSGDKAFDGNMMTIFGSRQESSPFLWVKLNLIHAIHSMTIYNRFPEDADRIIGFRIDGSNDSTFTNAGICYQDTSTVSSAVYDIKCSPPLVAQYFRIIIPMLTIILNIREFEIYECSDYWFGDECDKPCNCDKSDEICNKITGLCGSGCPPGFTGTDCYEACRTGYFGQNCGYRCHCLNSATCDRFNGTCPNGCSVGYTGDDCQTGQCTSQTPPCRLSCHCSDQTRCPDVTTRMCGSGGCASGWSGPTCQRNNVAMNDQDTLKASSVFDDLQIYSGDKAFDGDMTTIFGSKEESSPFLWVKLNLIHAIHSMKIYNRFPDSTDRIIGFRIDGSNDSTFINTQICYQDTSTVSSPAYDIKCSPPLVAQYFRIIIPMQTIILNIREFEIHECSDYWFGDECDKPCNCKNLEEICHQVTGLCGSGCPPGFTGTDCYEACVEGSYGMACNKTCHCSKAGDCDKVNGSCLNGCAPGYRGPSCQMACVEGSYGMACNETCHCSKAGDCDKVNGSCLDGCAPGYRGPSCQMDCPDGTFGANCEGSCHCTNPDSCRKTDGYCSNGGCSPGYKNSGNCQTGCDTGRFGEGCASSCHCENDEQCDRVFGNCTGSCSNGFTGIACQTLAQIVPASDSSLVGGVVGGLVGFLVIVGVVIAVIAFMRRRRANGKPPDEPTRAGEAAILHPIPVRNNEADRAGDGVAYANAGLLADLAGSTTSVDAEDLSSYVRQKLEDEKSFQNEFLKLPSGLLEPCEAAKMPGNIKKCRYKGMLPYDRTRVVLDVLDNDPFTDFINANYIDGYSKKKAYIASQGTTGNNLNDFWRMVWKVQAGKIIMLTNLVEGAKMKVEQYWPDGPDWGTYGAIKIQTIDVQELADCCIRTLKVLFEGKVRTVKQFHYRDWPDHDVPHDTSGIIAFRERVNSTMLKLNGPDIVHCSAGVGRTGTYLAFDYLMDKLQRENLVDIFQCVSDLRHQRTQMVQTPDQYTFLHMLVSDAFTCGGSNFTTDDFISTSTTSDAFDQKIHDQFERLEKVVQLPDRMKSAAASRSPNLNKNRDPDYVATDACRVWLSTTVPGRNDYINAVFLPVTKDSHRIIATQMPLRDSAVDLWRMLYEKQCSTIVMLNSETEGTGIYWPTGTKPIFLGPFEISLLETTKSGSIVFSKLSCVFTQMKDSSPLIVQQICLTSWVDESDVPPNPELILQLKDSIEDYQRKIEPGPIVVHCRDGCHKTGLFCVALGILDRIQEEQLVSIMLVINRVRTACPKAIISLAQYRFCYDLVKAYLDSFNTYANFN